jgi:hypothetical protein
MQRVYNSRLSNSRTLVTGVLPRPICSYSFGSMRKQIVISALLLAACSAPGGPYPSLQPRASEAIDPRVPVTRPTNDRPVATTLAARLAALVDQARSGASAFDAAAAAAERLASAAGAPQSESWIIAQESLTAAVAARRPAATALADIDEIGARAVQAQGGLAPSELSAINRAGSEVASINDSQAARVAAIQRRLGL